MPTEQEARMLRWARSRFDRHIAGKPAAKIDLALLEEIVPELRALDAAELPEREKLLEEVRRAQHPATASETLWWGHVANQQFEVEQYQLGETVRPFEALPARVYARLIRRLDQILEAMKGKPKSASMDQCIGAVESHLSRYRAKVNEIERLRARLDDAGTRRVLAEACDELGKTWPLFTAPHPSLVDPLEAGSFLDRIFACIVELDALGPSAEADRARALGDAFLDTYAKITAAQAVVPDASLPTARTKPAKLVPHTDVDRRRAIRALLTSDLDESDDDAGGPLEIPMKRGGELVLLSSAIAVFATLGPRNTRSHFAERHLFRWLAFRDKTWDYHQDLRSERDRAGGPRPVHLFVRVSGDKNYFYGGVASVVATRDVTRKPGVWVDLALERAIPLERWRRLSGYPAIVATRTRDHEFPHNPGEFARWAESASTLSHLDLVRETGAKLTMHGAGARVELEYRAAHDAPLLSSVDASLSPEEGAAAVEIACPCGRTRELAASNTVPRAAALAAMIAFIEEDGTPPSIGVRVPPPPTKNAWLARYRAGEHVAVWEEIRALGADVRRDENLGRAMEVLREMMLRVRANVDLIVSRLREFGYRFEAPSKTRVPPTDAARAALAAPPEGVPLCLTAFLGIVGAVNLVQSERQRTHEDVHHRAGSLTVLGQEGPLELEAAPTSVDAPHRWALFREDCLKADFSGDYVYVDLPAAGADAPLIVGDEAGEGFIDYLRATIAQGGFRGHTCEGEHADERGFGRVPRAFADFLGRDLEPF
ncbi:MAG: hypothetical protein U0414_06830 [Polyangiaceae bacterium]